MRKRSFSLIMLTVVVSTLMASIARADDKVLAAITGRYRAVQNVTVSYDSAVVHTPPPDAAAQVNVPLPKGVTRGPKIQGPETESATFSFNSGSLLLDRRISPETMQMHATGGRPTSRELLCISPERVELLSWWEGKTDPGGSIEPTRPIAGNPRLEFWTVDLALGLRMWHGDYLKEDDVSRMQVAQAGANAVTVTCVGTYNSQHQWTFDLANGHALRSYEVKRADGLLMVEVKCDDFRRFGDAMVPMKITRRDLSIPKDGAKEGSVLRRWEIQVTNYVVPDPANTPTHFLMVWPKGIKILDERHDLILPAKPSAQRWTDEAIMAEGKPRKRVRGGIQD
jgi:hypothetical protein